MMLQQALYTWLTSLSSHKYSLTGMRREIEVGPCICDGAGVMVLQLLGT